MLNIIWFAMIFLAVIVGVIQGRIDQVVQAVTSSAKLGFEVALGLAGIMALWLGLMAIATESGLIKYFSKVLNPLMRPLFPDVPVNHPAMDSMSLNIAANILGLGNAATPFGIKAMQELQTLNKNTKVATDAMCAFLAINTSSVQIIPATAIAFLVANNSTNPNDVIFSSLMATTISTFVAIIAVKFFVKLPIFKLKMTGDDSVVNNE